MMNNAFTKLKHDVPHDWVELNVSGNPMEAYLAYPEGEGQWPAVIVLMEIFGVNEHIREVTRRIAAEGYVAIAPNYYHRQTGNLELGYTPEDVVQGRKYKEQTTRDGLLLDVRTCIEFLQKHGKVSLKDKMGCIGFCFGGHVAFIAAGLPQIASTASFYGAGIAHGAPASGDEPTLSHVDDIHGEIICLFGNEDVLISQEETERIQDALRKAGVRSEVIHYNNTGHGFFCNLRQDYDPSAAEDAWDRVKALFARTLK